MKSHRIKITNTRLRPNSLVDFPSYKKVFINKSFDVNNCLNEFVVFDTETTGLDPQNDSVIQLSAVKYKKLTPVESWNTYLNPGTPISDGAAAVNGITNEMLEGNQYILVVPLRMMTLVRLDILLRLQIPKSKLSLKKNIGPTARLISWSIPRLPMY